MYGDKNTFLQLEKKRFGIKHNMQIKELLTLFYQGFRIFPIAGNKKSPPIAGWQKWSIDCSIESINTYCNAHPESNWGINCEASNLIVVDIDRHGDQNGFKEFNKFIEKYQIETVRKSLKTFQVSTPGLGLHLYYKGTCATKVGIIKGVDIRSKGSYVVAPGSIINNKIYTPKSTMALILESPEWLLDLLKERKEILVNQIENKGEIVAIEGSRNSTLVSIAGVLRSKGVNYEGILHALTAINKTQINPPLSSSEISLIAKSVSRYSPAVAVPASEFLEKSSVADAPKLISEFKGDAPDRKWLIKDWLPLAEISSLYGEGGFGKSLIALQLAMSITSNNKFLGLNVGLKIPVLCVFCEDSEEEIHRRKNMIKKSFKDLFNIINEDDMQLFLWPRAGKNNDVAKMNKSNNDIIRGSFFFELEQALLNMPPGNKLLILDNLSDIYLCNENIREYANKFIKTILGTFISKYQCTILLLAHPSRAGVAGSDILSGSTAWSNSVRNRLVLVRHKTIEDAIVLTRKKSNYAKAGEEILLKWNNGSFNVIKENPTASDSSDVRSSLAYIMRDVMIMSLKDAARGLGNDVKLINKFSKKSLSTIERYLEQMLQYPLEFHNFIFKVENKTFPDKKSKRWIVKQ